MGATDPAAALELAVDLPAIRAAHARIRSHVHRTPVLTSRSLDAAAEATLFFKCENLQKVGAFKARGACNAIFSLDEAEARRGVVTHSSGNHGAAVAWAAARRGIPAWVVMPENSAEIKKAAVQGLGATVRFCAPTLEARDATCAAVQAETGALLVHPYDDWRVIAGQGTAALELLEEIPDLDAVITPVGGGGLLSGTAVASRAIKPSIHVYGAEPAGADDAWRSLQSGRIVPQTDPRTIADGLRSSLGVKTFAVLSTLVDAIGTTSEEAIVRAMRLTWDKLKLIIEPSSAVPLAALLERKLPVAGLRVGIVISGGNVDLDRLPWQH
ncbi:MAG TPA: pyridoxal-phosphate dependent enzyme [Casimicrobiaceae bacterium]|jgi:threonine dehydratase|nr:pyridoxal-phosphate dependent enzyme [Casimicrobiaceae bacterium]